MAPNKKLRLRNFTIISARARLQKKGGKILKLIFSRIQDAGSTSKSDFIQTSNALLLYFMDGNKTLLANVILIT